MSFSRYDKKPKRPLDPISAERVATRFSRLSERFKKEGNILGARYRAELAAYVLKNKAIPSSNQRNELYHKAKRSLQGGFVRGKSKGYDVYPPDEGGPSILRGVAIVKGPDNYSMRFPSMEDALNYVRVHNTTEFPVRVHKKP